MSARPRVLVAMSGGVDSSVAAALLQRDGYDVLGCFMRLGSPGESLDQLDLVEANDEDHGDCSTGSCDPRKLKIGHQGCCSINDAQDARRVAGMLGIPLYVCNFKKDFGRIIDYFVRDYNAGRTPNPCVRCNDWLKFGKLFDHARALNCDFVATGHYARVRRVSDLRSTPEREAGGEGSSSSSPPRTKLLRGLDQDKDQSYVLFGLPQDKLAHVLLPIGEMGKSTVRALAEEFGLPVAHKPDSQEICFVPDNDYAGLVKRRSPGGVKPGRIVDTQGNDVGEHPGHQHFTIGQRRGVGVALGHPIYVVEKNPAMNTITIGSKDDLLCAGCIAGEVRWHDVPTPVWRTCTAKIRYNSDPVHARVRMTSDDDIEVTFDQPQHAVAAGQAVVCFDADEVIVGGWITNAVPIA